MKSRRYRVLAATVGLWMAHHGLAFAQPPSAPSRLEINPSQTLQNSPAVNQQLADTIASQLRQSGQLRHYNVNVRVEAGVVELTGQVTDQTQREEVLRIVQGVPGVDRVQDQLQIVSAHVTPVAAVSQPALQDSRPVMQMPPQQFTPPAPTPMPSGSPTPMPAEPNPFYREPVGIGGPNPAMMGSQPPMPPYAWPAYAPYNNFSRVAYPTNYPLEAFPFIGPFNPYPKVPLGWRSVTLKWEDGHWWYGRKATGYDFWRVRYW